METPDYAYSTAVPQMTYSYLVQAKTNAFELTKKHINQFDKLNPKQVCYWVRTDWYTDQTDRKKMTGFMKGVTVPGIGSQFLIRGK